LLCGLPAVLAQKAKEKEKPTPGDEMIYKYLCAETDKLSQKFMDGAKTLDEWQKKRPRLHQQYMDMLGLWPIPEKTPLKATSTAKSPPSITAPTAGRGIISTFMKRTIRAASARGPKTPRAGGGIAPASRPPASKPGTASALSTISSRSTTSIPSASA